MDGPAWETLETHSLQRVYAHSWLRAMGSVGLTAGYYLLVFHCLGFLFRQAWATTASWHGLILVPAWLGLAAWAAKWCLLGWIFGPQAEVFPTVVMTSESQPKLYATLLSLSRELDVEMPESFELAAYPTAYHCQPSFYGLTLPFWTIGVGLPLFSLLGAAEVRAILGHELGHRKLRSGRPWLSRSLSRQFNFYRGVIASSTPLTIRTTPYHWYSRLQIALLWPFGGREELEADQSAVEAMDHGTHALALQRIAQAQILFRDFLVHVEATKTHPENVFQAFRIHVEELTAADLEAATLRYRNFDRARLYNGRSDGDYVPGAAEMVRSGCGIMPLSSLDSHPVLEDRVEYLREVQNHYPYRSTNVRGTLYRVDEAAERFMTQELFSRPGWRKELPAGATEARSSTSLRPGP